MSEPHKKEKVLWAKNRVGPPYTALTLDTCIYERHGFRFDSGLLEKLQDQSIQIVIPEIVSKEVQAHLREKESKASKGLKSAISEFQDRYFLEENQIAQIDSVRKLAEEVVSLKKFDRFVEGLKNHVPLNSSLCSTTDLVDAYSKGSHPFTGPRKKNEFPDAIALLSLEEWAKQNGEKVLAVSNDKGWLSFSEQSAHIDVVSDLGSGLREIQKPPKGLEPWIHNYLSSIKDSKSLTEQVEQHLKSAVEKANAVVDTDITYAHMEGWEGEIVHEEIMSLAYLEDTLLIPESQDKRHLSIVSYSAEDTSFAVDAYIDVDADAEFTGVFYDENGDVVDVGEKYISGEMPNMFIRLLFSFDGDVVKSQEIPNIKSLSIIGNLEIPFGDVEFGS